MVLRFLVSACLAAAAVAINLPDQTDSPLEEILAQKAVSAEVCQRAATRNK